MKSKIDRQEIIKEIIYLIEHEFEGVTAVWIGRGTPSDNFSDDTEVFEAYMVEDKLYDQFVEFKWQLRAKIARPLGFSIVIHDLNPAETKEYRWTEYKNCLASRALGLTKYCFMPRSRWQRFHSPSTRNEGLSDTWQTDPQRSEFETVNYWQAA